MRKSGFVPSISDVCIIVRERENTNTEILFLFFFLLSSFPYLMLLSPASSIASSLSSVV